MLAGLVACADADERPNLLLVTVDTLRADALACYGGAPDLGEALCSVAEQGQRHVWAFSTAPTTSPSIASLHTSRFAAHHGVTQNLATALGDEHPTLAGSLRDAGYATAAVVSNPILDARRRLDRGFDHYDARMTRRERNRPGFAERDARATSDAALAWLAEAGEGPWFLWVHYQDPHGPYEPPEAPPARDPAGAARLPVLEEHYGRDGIPKYQALPGVRSAVAYRERYLDEIRHLDRELARLLERADAGTRPTALLVTADHGESLGEDGYYFAHGHSVGLEQVRIPLLFRPASPAGGPASPRRSVSLVDVAPTLLHEAGVPVPEAFVGVPLQEPPPAARPLFAEAGRQIAIVSGELYSARDRAPGARTTEEGRPFGAEHPALPARHAALGEGDALPDYRAGAAESLEPALRAYIATRPATARPDDRDVPDALKRQLEALGYASDE